MKLQQLLYLILSIVMVLILISMMVSITILYLNLANTDSVVGTHTLRLIERERANIIPVKLDSQSSKELKSCFFSQYTPHLPITISSDENFLTQAEHEGWSGSGTQDDPIVITGLNITSNAKVLINISRTDLYFQLSNNFLNGPNTSSYTYAIYLGGILHGTIANNIIYNVSCGIKSDFCHFNSISGNEIIDNGLGIYLKHSSFVTLSSNRLINNVVGIELYKPSTMNNFLVSNFIANNTGSGIVFVSSSCYNVI
ncbi:MAG: NosD domain-containing protein, partial [Candidatus Hodarchaeota archaeon]